MRLIVFFRTSIKGKPAYFFVMYEPANGLLPFLLKEGERLLPIIIFPELLSPAQGNKSLTFMVFNLEFQPVLRRITPT